MITLPKISALPLELCSKTLQPFAQEREPVICLQIPSVGNFTPLRLRGRTNRSYRFEWDRQKLCHVLRVPAALWAAENSFLAKDVFHQTLARPVIPVVEVAEEQNETAAKQEKPETPTRAGHETETPQTSQKRRGTGALQRRKATSPTHRPKP
jgi:hypothetical protein